MTPDQFLLFADPLPEPTLLLSSDGHILAGNHAVETSLGVSLSSLATQRLAEVVVESADEVARYLRLCCRSRSLVQGAMKFHGGRSGHEAIDCRLEGSLICAGIEGSDTTLMLRVIPKESQTTRFGALNQRIDELQAEVERRERADTILAAQKHVLELLVQDVSLAEVLDAICLAIESQSHCTLIATVLLLDEDGQRLHSVAGKRAPVEYARAINGVAIGRCVGSCGTAAYRGQQVVVSDIATDPLWADYKELALNNGLQACWSTPILSSGGKVLGTFAVYSLTPRGPLAAELQFVDILTRTAGVAIERRRGEQEVRFQARLLDTVGQAAIVTNRNGEIIYWNRFAETLYGWQKEDALGRNLFELVVAQDDRGQAAEIMDHLRAGEVWSGEFEVQRRDGTTLVAFVTDTPLLNEQGEITAIIGISVDISDRKRLESSLRLLADASAVLADLVDYQSTLQKVAALSVPQFADWCAVDIAEPDGTLRRLAVTHANAAKVHLA